MPVQSRPLLLSWSRLFTVLFILLSLWIGSGVRDIPTAYADFTERPLQGTAPAITLNVPATAFIGTNIVFTVTFDNPHLTDPGYGPIIDLIIPTNGADGTQNTNLPLDGLTFVSATYLGVSLESTILTFPGSGGVTCVDHPYIVDSNGNPVQVCGDAGDTFVALRLPFGSFTPDQPPLTVEVTTSMSNLADLGTPLTIQARGGYQFGYTPINDFTTDPPNATLSGWTSVSVTPTLFILSKSYDGPEDETATGPNFPRRYTVTATIAPGQTMSPFTLSDILPANMQFVSLVSTSPSGANCTLPSTTTPGGTLSCDFASVNGTVSMTFEYYIPLRDADDDPVIAPTSGDDVTSCNNASGGGNWTPIDPRDTAGTFTQNQPGCEHTLADKSIAIQKTVNVVGGDDAAPGKVLEYTLDFQISDFFAFKDVIITDTISDGQHVDPTFTPTLQINGNRYTLNVQGFNANNYDVACHYTGAGAECESNTAPLDGTTTLIFRVSNEIVTRGQDGRLIGGCVPTSGTGGNDPNCSTYNDDPTTGRIVFRTVIQENFTDTYPSGDPSVDQGDILNNTVQISGALLSIIDAQTPTGQSEDDTSAASISLARGGLTKSIYAVNGNTNPSIPVNISPGDHVTFRLTYTLVTSDFEDLVITDYLPLPVFDATQITTFTNTVCGIPAAGTSCLGPSDTYHTLSGSISPALASDSTSNWVRWTYGDYDNTYNQPSTIDVLFTVTVTSKPFADRLYLTNQGFAQEGSTNSTSATSTAITQVILNQPVLKISKGVVWTNGPKGVFAPPTVGPVSFDGTAATCASRLGGLVHSSGLAANPVNSNLSNVDAADQVMMAIIIENIGHASAFDVKVRDSLPSGMTYVSNSLCVTDGTGATMSYTDLGGGLFGSGIELNDPGPTSTPPGALDPGKDTNGNIINNGRNIAIITYLVTLNSNVQGGQILTNTATVFNYAGTESGLDHTVVDLQDTAQTQVRYDGLGKTFTTEIINGYNTQTQAVIGELVEYTLTLIFHEGIAPNVTLEDNLPSGLAFVKCVSITPSSTDLSTDLSDGFSAACNAPSNPIVSSPGQNVTFTLGTITNANTDNTVDETLTIVFHAVVLNVPSNQAGTNLVNSATLKIDGGTGGVASVTSAPLTLIEPTINTSKSATPTAADADDILSFTVTLNNPASGSTTAYDVIWSDTIPNGLTYVADSASGSCGATPLTISFDAGTNALSTSISQLDPGGMCTIQFQAKVNYGVSPGQSITNTAETRWTSLPGAVTNRSSYNDNSNERDGTGGLLNSGALNDYRTQGQAGVTINTTTPQKYLRATSEVHTGVVNGSERVTIGEIVRYRLVVQLPEGTSPNFQIRDYLPTGLTYLDDGTARLALLSNGAPITSTEPIGSTLGLALGNGPFGSGPWVNGNDPTLVTPTYVLPDQNVGSSNSLTSDPDSYGTGNDPFFKLGTLTNNDSDTDAEYVILEFNALVDNTPTGSNDAGDNRDNNFQVYINDQPNGNSSNSVRIYIAEPLLSLNKSAVIDPSGDAGDTVTYTLTISAASGDNRSTAFDLHLTDTFDTYLTALSITSVTSTQGSTCNGGATFSHNGGVFTGNTLTFTASCLDPGKSITITVRGTVAANTPVGYAIPNTAKLTWTSLPGTGTSSNATGSSTPGSSGALNGERDGSGGINDYAASSSAGTSLALPQIDKRQPSPVAYAIGEQVTFNILITLPEGVAHALTLVDNLPAGLRYVSHQMITTAAASGGLLTADYNGSFTQNPPTVTCSGTCASGDDITLDFGDATTVADNVTTNNTFLVQVTAIIVNESGNQNNTTLTNTATVSWSGGMTSDSVSVSVIEPELNITKAADDITPAYSQILTYTLTVSHLPTSTATAHDIVVTDTVPSGLTYVSGSISAPTGWATNDTNAPTLTWTCSAPCSLPVGNTANLTYKVTVNGPPGPPNPGDTLTNTASMTWTSTGGANPEERSGTGGINDYHDSASQTATLTYPDLRVTKTDNRTSYVPGSPLTYTIVVSNVGNGDAMGAILSDSIPPQITSWTWTCTTSAGGASGCDSYSGNGNFSDMVNLPAGSSITYTVTAQTDPAATTNLTNTVTINLPDNQPDPTLGDNTASDTDTPNPQADLSVTKDDGVIQYVPGSTLTYTITLSNAGPSDAPGSVVTDAIPSQFISWTWDCTAQTGGASGCDGYSGSGDFTDLVNLPAGSSITYTVTAQIASSATGNLINTIIVTPPVGVTDPSPNNNTASDTDAQNSQAAISVTKDDGATHYIPGNTVTYTITVINTGPSDALGVNVTDLIPSHVTSWTWTCSVSSGGASGCTSYSGSGDFTDTIDLAGPFPSSITYTVAAQVASSAMGNLINTVTISHPADTNPEDNTASDTDAPNYQADLYVIKDDGSTTYTPGVGVTYTVTIGNNGPSDVNGAVLTDAIPTQALSWTWSCSGSSGGAAGCDGYGPGNGNFTDTVDLPAGSSITYTVTVVIPPSAIGDLVNTAIIQTPTGVTDPGPNNNTATDTDTQNSQADLSITKDDGVTEYIPGGTVTYTITVANTGPSDALGASVSDSIPPQITSWTWTCGDSSGGASGCDGYSGSGDFTDLVNLPAGSSITYTVTAQIASSATGNLINAITVTPPVGVTDPSPNNNTASDTDTPNPQADLSVTKDDGVTVVAPNSTIIYTVTVSNAGPSDAIGAIVSDLKPAQIDTWDWVCTTQSGGASGCDGSSGPITMNFTDTVNLPAGSSITYTITAHVAPNASGTLTNRITIALPDGVDETDSTDNTDDDVDTILTTPTGDLTKSLIATNQDFTTASSVAIGEILTYEVTFTVPAGGTLPDLTLTDVLDRGLAFVECLGVLPSSTDITTTLPGGFSAACNVPSNPTIQTEPPGSTNPADPGRRITFSLGSVSNSGATDGTVTLQYNAVVLDTIENQDGATLGNKAVLTWASGTLDASAPQVSVLEPDLELQKTASPTVAPPGAIITFTLTLRHTSESHTDAFDVLLKDTLPAGLTYIPGSLAIVHGPAGGVIDDSAAPILKVSWPVFPRVSEGKPTEAVVQFKATLGDLDPGQKVTNTAWLTWSSLPGEVVRPQSPYNTTSTERFYDPDSQVNTYGISAQAIISTPELPSTGFAPARLTPLPQQPQFYAYQPLNNLWLEIPKINLRAPIIGIPLNETIGWDLTWLSSQVGWLEGTAFPTWKGNSALTAHVYLANGQPGPFFNLRSLHWGDQIIVHLGNQRYIYEVREVRRVWPDDLSILRHEKFPWLTLITCQGYDLETNDYRYRLAVRAVQVKIEPEP